MRFALIAAILSMTPVVLSIPPKSFTRIRKIVAFGDSLTDTGVVAGLTKHNGPQIPSNAYYKGAFTNGKVWLDYVADAKSVDVQNFAAGGATTSDALVQGWVGGKFGEPLRDDGSVQKVPGVDTQIKSYLWGQDWYKWGILYTIFVGPNDLFDNQILGLGKNASYFAAAQFDEWKTLVAFGATQIMTMVLPKELDPFYALYGSTLDDQIDSFKSYFPWVNIVKYEVPIAAFLPTSYTPNLNPGKCCTDCFNGLPPKGNATVCDTPNAFLLWDGLHPTTVVHKFIADDVAAFIDTNFGF